MSERNKDLKEKQRKAFVKLVLRDLSSQDKHQVMSSETNTSPRVYISLLRSPEHRNPTERLVVSGSMMALSRQHFQNLSFASCHIKQVPQTRALAALLLPRAF